LSTYNAVNVAVDWDQRQMYVSGTAYYKSESAIRRVSLDAASPKVNPEVVVAANTSANAMAFAGGSLYYVQVSVNLACAKVSELYHLAERSFSLSNSGLLRPL
jgi:hypothetical protein